MLDGTMKDIIALLLIAVHAAEVIQMTTPMFLRLLAETSIVKQPLQHKVGVTG